MTGNEIRRLVIERAHAAHVGHIGSALCVADIVAFIMDFKRGAPDDPDRDRFVLSKGHAALALYAALYLKGIISKEKLESYGELGMYLKLGTHPERGLPGVDFSTGSLGQGVSYAVGAALAAKIAGSQRRIYCLASDAEMNEGIVWEAAMFAAHHKLDNLFLFIDRNGRQALGKTFEVLNTYPLDRRFAAFGWDAIAIDGHRSTEIRESVALGRRPLPHVIVCNTTFGSGVSFMEREESVRWHYMPLDDAQFYQAMSELADGPS